MRFAALFLLAVTFFYGCDGFSNPFSSGEEEPEPDAVDMQRTGPEIYFNDGPAVFVPNISGQRDQQVIHTDPVPDQQGDVGDDFVPKPSEILPPGADDSTDAVVADGVISNPSGQENADPEGADDPEIVVHHDPNTTDLQDDGDLRADSTDNGEDDGGDLWADEGADEPDATQNGLDEEDDPADPDDEDDLWADEVD